MQERIYAEALKRLIEGGKSPKEAVTAVRAALAARGRAALLPRVGRAFSRLMERAEASGGLVLSVARESDVRAAEKASASLAGGQKPRVRIDDSLIGGWRLEGNGRLVDMSFKKHLLAIYNRAVTK